MVKKITLNGLSDTGERGGVEMDMPGVTLESMHVALNGAVTAAAGTPGSHVLLPVTTFTGTAAKENYQDATGCKKFTVDPGAVVIGAGVGLVISYSTSASDTATTQAACLAAKTAHTTPDGARIANTFIITDLSKSIPVILWDGETTIKTISFLTTGAPSAAFKPTLIASV